VGYSTHLDCDRGGREALHHLGALDPPPAWTSQARGAPLAQGCPRRQILPFPELLLPHYKAFSSVVSKGSAYLLGTWKQ